LLQKVISRFRYFSRVFFYSEFQDAVFCGAVDLLIERRAA
jgi:hypothetical protein